MSVRAILIPLMLAGVLGVGCSGDDTDVARDGGTDALPPITFTHEDIQNACVRLGACEVQRHPRMRDCLENFYSVVAENGQRALYERLYYCANQGKGDCGVIRQCMGFYRRPQNPQLKCDSSYTPKCAGNVAHGCDLILGGWEQKLDCSKGGLKCAIKDTGTGTKAAICCAGTCDKTKYKTNCVNNRSLACVGGAIEINDCPSQVLQCRDPITGVCEGRGVSCASMNPACKGNVLTRCKNNFLWEIDCGKLPGKKKCDPNSNTCKGAGSECNEDATFDWCEGDKLGACLDGYKKLFDCKAMGFEGCKKATTGYGAYCHALPVYDK